jgi:hypothetical protein
MQLLSCSHYRFGAFEPPPDEERMPWTGEWPGARECREFGWCAKPDPAGRGYTSCGPDDPEAQPDLNRLHLEAVWDRRRKRFARNEDLGGRCLVSHWWLQDLAPDARTIGDMVDDLQEALDELRRMQKVGVVLAKDSDLVHGHAVLFTTDPSVANEFDFELEEGGDDEDGPGA